MARWKGTTTQRGLGAAWQRKSERMRKAMPEGHPCARCGGPMYSHQPIELDHLIPRRLGGGDGPVALAHQTCNRRAGAQLSNLLRKGKPRTQARKLARW